MLSVPLLIAAVGLYFWLTSGATVGTDNAYVKQDVTAISTQVNGPVAAVYVRENQHVNKGDVLYRIDPRSFEAALHAAEAQLAAAKLDTHELVVEAQGTGADIRGAEANIAIARRAFERQAALMKTGFTTKADYDDAFNDLAKAETELGNARAKSNEASAAIAPGGNQPAVAVALAAVEKARLDLSRTVIRAPTSGTVAQSDRLLVGQTAIMGVSMLSIVSDQAGLGRSQFQGRRIGQDGGRPARDGKIRRLPGPEAHGPCRFDRIGHGQRVFRASGAERQWQLGQGHPAGAGADRLRREAAARNDRGPEFDGRSPRRRQALRIFR